MSLDERPIFLIGFMGSGKSTVGRLLAAELDWEFLDTDEVVVQQEGRSIEQIFLEKGEGYFRRVEWGALRRLGGRRRCVVATGGGLFLGALQRRWMKRHGPTVWLDVPLEDCMARIGTGTGRPLWLPSDPTAFRALFEKRRCAYALAQIHETSLAEPGQVVRRLIDRLGLG
jgi:shikimate kinase